MSGSSMRGLNVFVSDIRNCESRENEVRRVQKELANIRAKYTQKKSISSYDRRKYCWKLVYIYMLGHDFDFGHTEVIHLISSNTFSEKQVGYIAASVLFTPGDDSIPPILETVRHDMKSNNENVQSLALSLVANLGGPEFAESLVDDIGSLLAGRNTVPAVRKKAALCLLRISRVNSKLVSSADWAGPCLSLLDDRDLGVELSIITLMCGLAQQDPAPFEAAVPHVLLALTRLAIGNSCTPDYLYYSTACPWLQVKLLRFLQYYPIPSDATHRSRLIEVLTKIVSHTEVTKSVNKNNADHSILFEALELIIEYGNETPQALRDAAVELAGRFLRVREPNIRYLGLGAMAHLAGLEGTGAGVRKNQSVVLYSLKEADVSIRVRALDLLYAMTHESNALEIVKELLAHLVTAQDNIKDEMVLKLAILAERFRPSLHWYVDTMLQMISVAGDNVGDPVWFRVIQIVTNAEPALQRYAAAKMYNALLVAKVHETTVKVGGYILGEFGVLLTDPPEPTAGAGAGAGEGGDTNRIVSGGAQFAALHSHFTTASNDTKALLLTAYIKMMNMYEELGPQVTEVLNFNARVMDAELQQRAVEYLNLRTLGEEGMGDILAEMPAFQTDSNLVDIVEAKSRDNENQADFNRRTNTKVDGEGGDDDDEDGDDDGSDSDGGGDPAANAADASNPAPLLDVTSVPTTATAAPSTAPTSVRRIDAAMAPQVLDWYNNFSAATSGVVYEDDTIQIGCLLSMAGSSVTCKLFFGNKSGSPLEPLKVRVPGTTALEATVSEVPRSVAPGQQAPVEVTLKCVQPFTDSLPLQVSFVATGSATGFALPLRLPVKPLHFVDGVTMADSVFIQRWNALEGNGREQIVIVAAKGTASVEVATKMMTACRLTHVPAAAAPQSVLGAGSMRTSAVAANGAPISIGLLVRVDVNTARNMYRLVVRAQLPAVAQAMAKCIVPAFGTAAGK